MSTVHTLFTWLSYVPAAFSPLLLAAFKPPALRRSLLAVPFTYASTRRSSLGYQPPIVTPTAVSIAAAPSPLTYEYTQPTLERSAQLLDCAAGAHFSGVHNTPVDESALLSLN